MSNINIGKIGEDIACKFLIKNKYKILFRNYRYKFDEIDIIARAFNGTLVFVEVKTLNKKCSEGLIPEDNLTSDKLRKISRACRLFAGSHKDLFDEKIGWQIDLISIILENNNEIHHYENIMGQ